MCVHSQSVSVRDLWRSLSPRSPENGVFALLTGYIDESYTGEKEPVTFGLNCVYSTYPSWFWIEVGWNKVIAEKNCQLIQQGRKPIRRFHSKEISNFENDFEGWNGEERTDFTRNLLVQGIDGNYLHSVGFTANLKDVAEDWPRVKFEGVKRFGYHSMLRLIMVRLESMIPQDFGPGARISLIHERCPFDGVLLDAFNFYLEKRPKASSLFTSITPMGWENCTPLQAADFFAYEAMKESHRFRPGMKPRERRKSLSAALELETVGAMFDEIPREEMLRWKKQVEAKDRRRGKAFLNNERRFANHRNK